MNKGAPDRSTVLYLCGTKQISSKRCLVNIDCRPADRSEGMDRPEVQCKQAGDERPFDFGRQWTPGDVDGEAPTALNSAADTE